MRSNRFETEIGAVLCFALEYSIVASSRDVALKQMVGTFLLAFFRGTNPLDQAVIIEPPEAGNDSPLVKHITSGLNDTSTSNQRVWLNAIRRNAENWFQERMRDVWINSGFAKQVVSCLSHSAESSVIWLVADTMTFLTRQSLVWRRKLLDEGAIGAIIGASTRFPNRDQQFFKQTLLRLFIFLWSSPEETQDMDLATDSILISLRQLLPSVREFDPVLNPNPVPRDRLQVFIDYLKKHRCDAAFIARQLDVPINRIYAKSARTWNYVLFQDVRPSPPCSRLTYTHDGLP